MFALLRKDQYVATPLPQWGQAATPATLVEFGTALRRHSPNLVLPPARDDGYCLVPADTLAQGIQHTLRTLQKQGIRYTKNAWDCEDFVNELHQTLRKMAALAGIELAPITCVISVANRNPWAGVPVGGRHALACVMTENGPVVVESQNGTRCSIEVYPNRTSIDDVDNL